MTRDLDLSRTVKRICTHAGGLPVLITIHFQLQWAERIGPTMELPLGRIARAIRKRGKGQFDVRFRKANIVVQRRGHMLVLVTVWPAEDESFSVFGEAA
jgi:hypothetical protein